MSRNVSFLVTLATGVVLASASPDARRAAGADLPQAQTDAAQAQTQAAPGKPAGQPAGEDAQGKTKETQAKTEGSPAQSEDAPAQPGGEGKLTSTPGGKALGMSILGNQEAPTSLVIVPWKTSELGNSLGISTMLDDSRQPIDKDVFMRSLRYYEIRSGTTGATTGGRDAAAGSDAAQSTAARRR